MVEFMELPDRVVRLEVLDLLADFDLIRKEAFMLCLTRREGEEVVIADGEIVLTVLEIRGDRVRLGFEAPTEIPIHRRETQQKIEEAKAGAR